jgi:chromosome partitioning protein
MAAVTISLANHKGGVGKTTLVLNLADALAREGLSVCVIDMDPQANLTHHLSPIAAPDAVAEIISTKDGAIAIDFNRYLLPTIVDNVALLPTTLKLNKLKTAFTNFVAPYRILDKRIKPLKDMFDVILIDTPPDLGLWLQMALTTSDFLVIPSDTSGEYTLQGTEDLLALAHEIREDANPRLTLLGAVATKVQGNNTSQAVASLIEGQFTLFETQIHQAAVVGASQLEKMTVLQRDRRCRCAKEFVSLAAELMTKCGIKSKRKVKPGPRPKAQREAAEDSAVGEAA